MIEIFKTNVHQREEAEMLVASITGTFDDYSANFDLGDCDKILRVQSQNDLIQSSALIEILNNAGFTAIILED